MICPVLFVLSQLHKTWRKCMIKYAIFFCRRSKKKIAFTTVLFSVHFWLTSVARVRAGWSPWKLEVIFSASLKMANIHYQLDLESPRRNISGCVGEDVSREFNCMRIVPSCMGRMGVGQALVLNSSLCFLTTGAMWSAASHLVSIIISSLP